MLTIFNTLTRQKQVFKPIRQGHVGIYVCGVTVYDYCHLGHARTYVSADMMVRYLRFIGYDVNYVRNITDIDDKIIKRAQESQLSFSDITEKFIEAMQEDFAALGLLPPNEEPRATTYVPHMIKLIGRIIENGHGYVADNGDVYFDVRSFSEYGQLSHHNIEQLESGARVEVVEAKKDPLDFVLWKLAKPEEPSWDSPWGKGRPGWHIECSAMSMDLLGEHFDIHGGGRDLIFPHHENEIAQSQAASREPFVNVWVHGGFLQIEKEKMSKSLGNFVTIRDVLKEHSPEVVRYLLLASHYRSPLVYSDNMLQQAKQALTRLYTALRFQPDAIAITESEFEKKFIAAMNDDFNTPIAMAVLFDLAHEIERHRNKDSILSSQYAALLRKLTGVLGLLTQNTERFFQDKADVDVDKIEQLILERNLARKNKDWARADQIREELSTMAIAIEDNANGTTWKAVK